MSRCYRIRSCWQGGRQVHCYTIPDNPTNPNADASPEVVNADASSPEAVVPGCTDAAADNYDAAATVDDGSCTIAYFEPLPRDIYDPMQEFLELLNAEREMLGCGSLVRSPYLDIAAERHSRDMKSRSYFAHIAPEPSPHGRLPRERMSAAGYDTSTLRGNTTENIAQGATDPVAMYWQWFNSPGHYTSMTDCKYESIGVALVDGIGTAVFAKGTDDEYASGQLPSV